ncbi:sucrose transport protein-like [Impatiens glandulifera]|uniref:sucrose transport protein-like n=1 Tax=Impatiens glandulifera TaxID=253017 RepID=UPI001FB156E9|nr:sucrose transport protein-like [Impatiens glandulifera]
MEVVSAAPTNGKHPPSASQPPSNPPPVSLFWRITAVASIGAGVQFGWALQFSLLTPYIQLLGIPHQWASYIWLCGPVSGLIVQPLAGHYSDNCTSRFGRRRPFITSAAFLVTLSVILIGFAADLGRKAGDTLGSGVKPRAIAIFVVGFWVLDVGNNLLMAPCRALLGDLSDGEQRRARNANAAFSFFMAIGSVAGYAAGSYSRLYKFLPFTMTEACDIYCANLKTCFLISATLLIGFTTLALFTVPEKPFSRDKEEEEGKNETRVSFFSQLWIAVKLFPRSMWVLLMVVSLTSLGLFAFILYDTDWMGKEVFGGKVGDGKLYDRGVRTGSLGLMLNSAVGGVTALAIMFLVRGGKTANRVWGLSNILLGVCLATTVLITKEAQSYRRHSLSNAASPSSGVKASALALFAVLGLPQTITFTVPFALASIFSSSCGAGQGLTMGVLNIAVVIPQLIVSVTSGPWDELFGGGNLPSFVVGAISAVIAGILALTLLPTPKSTDTSTIEIRH